MKSITMAAIKTAISIPRDVYEDMEKLSKRLRVPRSRLFSRAAQEFLQRHRAEELMESYNRVYAKGLSAEEKRFLRGAKHKFGKLTEESW